MAILAAIVAISYGIFLVLGLFSRPGYAVADLGRGPIEEQHCTPRFNSSPPTSGCHSQSKVAYGVHDEPIPAELQVHNLEHGAVIIQYRPSGIIGVGDALAQDLDAFVNRLRNSNLRYCRLIAAPHAFPFSFPNRPEEETSPKVIALTAWGRIDVLDTYDEARIKKFIDAFINQGPESSQLPQNECQ
ncbi:MAG: hypothetical protein A2Z21_03670 [Candidatus Fraserbacteria bacterium RBG_16_55_9]|uniref:DUF3105 domain-containing protein n=1 Tax=Fraserbacteria sp. (strain RBG_16_55_9) TaxID=1817864 RepID=A0A1F5UND7_FRAXR|nr:MAG: hypothetical protein A2Z21_03670 [Candidatus Fraserbacteria bacterium RBG_16_55_9]